MPRPEREKRMQTYQEFVHDADLVRSGSSEFVSEIDLANPRDLRVVMAGLPGLNVPQAITLHFGSGDFTGKYRMTEVGEKRQRICDCGPARSGRLAHNLQTKRQRIDSADLSHRNPRQHNDHGVGFRLAGFAGVGTFQITVL